LNPSDEICIYEVDPDGNMILVYCSDYANLDFVPGEGKTYKLTINGDDFEINFKTIDCGPEIIASQNGQSDCLEEGQPIQFDIQGANFDPNCYYLEWNFGDCTDVLISSTSDLPLEHTFEFAMSPSTWCKNFTVTVKAISFCEGCEDYEFSQTITVCQYCYVEEYDGDLGIDVSVFPNPTQGPIVAEMFYEGGEVLQHIIINQQWDGNIIHMEDLPQDMQFPYFFNFDLSGNVPGQYNIIVVSDSGASASTTVLKL